MTKSSTPVRIVEETPAHWRVLFDNPPLNVVDGTVFDGLQQLLSRMDTSPSPTKVKVSPEPSFGMLLITLTVAWLQNLASNR